jgi:hypothetical protein
LQQQQQLEQVQQQQLEQLQLQQQQQQQEQTGTAGWQWSLCFIRCFSSSPTELLPPPAALSHASTCVAAPHARMHPCWCRIYLSSSAPATPAYWGPAPHDLAVFFDRPCALFLPVCPCMGILPGCLVLRTAGAQVAQVAPAGGFA